MQATSILDIYTSVLGWHVSNNFWKLLEMTGLFLIPFIAVVISNLKKARESKDKNDIGVLAYRLSETQIYVMFFTILLLVKPTINLNHELVRVETQWCSASSAGDDTTPKWGNTGSTLDRQSSLIDASLEGQKLKIPILWYPLEFYARAFTESAKYSLPCQPALRALSAELTAIRISDPILRDETEQFYSQCWRPSGNRYLRERFDHDPEVYPDIREDVSWIGSRFFNEHPKLYHRDRPSEGLKSFPYDEARDDGVVPKEYSGGLGWPFCAEWWTSNEYGLRKRLLEHFNENSTDTSHLTFFERFKLKYLEVKSGVINDYDVEDQLLKQALKSDLRLKTQVLSNNYTREQTGSTFDKITSGVSQNIMGIGLTVKSGSYGIEMQTYQYAATVIQALLLMLLTITFPVLAVFGQYRLEVIFALLVLKISVIFWGFLFHLAFWLDNFLLDGLMDHSNAERAVFSLGAFAGDFDPTVDILNYVTQALYIVLPIIFSSLMGVAGYAAGSGLGGMVTDQGKSSAGAGRSGADAIQNAATKTATKK